MRPIINLVGVELLHWLTETCSTGHTGSIHANFLGADMYTHMYTHIEDKSNFKKPVGWCISGTHGLKINSRL